MFVLEVILSIVSVTVVLTVNCVRKKKSNATTPGDPPTIPFSPNSPLPIGDLTIKSNNKNQSIKEVTAKTLTSKELKNSQKKRDEEIQRKFDTPYKKLRTAVVKVMVFGSGNPYPDYIEPYVQDKCPINCKMLQEGDLEMQDEEILAEIESRNCNGDTISSKDVVLVSFSSKEPMNDWINYPIDRDPNVTEIDSEEEESLKGSRKSNPGSKSITKSLKASAKAKAATPSKIAKTPSIRA